MMLRGLDRWLFGYLASIGRREPIHGPVHILFCIADHFEPLQRTILDDGRLVGGASEAQALAAVESWCSAYADMVAGIRDADGYPPRHSLFYPWDEYSPACLERLRNFCRSGYGEVEIHLHHRADTPAGFRQKLEDCRRTYAQDHGLLGRRKKGEAQYAFVHGNWALCNARPDGDWCGVSRELEILRDTGCYADLTFPSAPSPTQPRTVNAIYYGRDPASHERGHRRMRNAECGMRNVANAECGMRNAENELLMVQGPLGLNWRDRKAGVLPRLENGEISQANPATALRMRLWQRFQVHVIGRPEWVVVKLHTHGMSQHSRAAVVGTTMRQFHKALVSGGGSKTDHGRRLHYVTARELYNIIKAAEAGHGGNPGEWRNFEIASPPCCE